MIIGIVPTIREPYKNQIEFSVDLKLLSFLRQIKKNSKFIILCEKRKYHFDFLCLSGGNDVEDNSEKSKFRKKLDRYFYSKAKKSNIPVLGICHGAQFIIKKEGGKIVFDKKHVSKNHLIFSKNRSKFLVNSFHNYKIIKISNKFNILFKSEDGSIEAFRHKEKKILGIMWHPERYKKIKKFDVEFLNKYL